MSLHENLRKYRERHGFTKAALAEMVGITKQSYQAIESGKVDPKLDTLVRLSQALRVSTDKLLDNDTDHTDFDFAVRLLRYIANVEEEPNGLVKVTLCSNMPCYAVFGKEDLLHKISCILYDRRHLKEEFSRWVVEHFVFAKLNKDN